MSTNFKWLIKGKEEARRKVRNWEIKTIQNVKKLVNINKGYVDFSNFLKMENNLKIKNS